MNNDGLKLEFKNELARILSWWTKYMVDAKNDGFYGRRDGFGKVYEKHSKGIVLNARILWAFSAAARVSPSPFYKVYADRCFHYLISNFWDKHHGGLFWTLNFRGELESGKKQLYAQAFGIYAFAEYYLLTKNEAALKKALRLFSFIESKARDTENGGYFEAFGQDWSPLEDVRLSDKDANDQKTMNTHLHILEAYTSLYRCVQNDEVSKALGDLIHLYIDKFIDQKDRRLKLFFNENWEENIYHHSFGHEIESAWLIVEAAEVLGEEKTLIKAKEASLCMTNRVYDEALASDKSMYFERNMEGVFHEYREWWSQAEAVVGFQSAYEMSTDQKFKNVSLGIWEYIKANLINQKGEWYWGAYDDGKPVLNKDMAGPWKAPYHNSRMCIEMIKRL